MRGEGGREGERERERDTSFIVIMLTSGVMYVVILFIDKNWGC